jgi:hypothetical protein
MPKKGVQIIITGSQRPKIDVDAMTQIIIAMGRELAARKRVKRDAEVNVEMETAP